MNKQRVRITRKMREGGTSRGKVGRENRVMSKKDKVEREKCSEEME